MNPSASSYVPSSAVAGALARRRATPPVTPPVTTHLSAPPQPSAADRLRQINAMSARTAPGPGAPPRDKDAAAAASPPSPSSSPVRGVIYYSKQQLLSLRPATMERLMRGRIVDHPPFLKIPESFAQLLSLPHALEYVNVEAATQLVERRSYASPLLASTSSPSSAHMTESEEGNEDTARVRSFTCSECATGGLQPCPPLQRILQRAARYAMSTKLGAVLMQPPLVVESLLRLALVFEAKQSSLRLRLLAERSPRVVHLVEEFLCGEGYHLPMPAVTAHEEWVTLNGMLKFDAIRDNKTRIITDLSKHWKKRKTPFEQFVHFFEFRDARPVRPVKNIVTQSVKPGMVAMLMGDVTAMMLLHRLGFFLPPDYYWKVYPFLRQALGEGTVAYDVVRHLGLYFSSAQPQDLYNPVPPPHHTA